MSVDGRAFVDTNILVYAHDTTAGTKRKVSAALIEGLWESGHGCVSIQVLQELFVTLTRKLAQRVEGDAAQHVVADFARWTVHVPDAEDVLAAIDLHERYRISFWDAMIARSAAQLGCNVLYSEDLSPGQQYDGVVVVDPFARA